MGKIVLFHGSNMEIAAPKIIESKRLLDFGHGFYLTSDYEQAKKWAVRTATRREEGRPVISVFEAEENEIEKLNVLRFEKPDRAWLVYVSENRTNSNSADNYDIVAGPVANDQAIRTVNNYLRGYFNEDIAIQLLLPQKLKDQYAFKTKEALSLLIFKEGKSI